MAKNTEYIKALKVAVLSARSKAPDLVPIVIITGGKAAAEIPLKEWLQNHGAYVIRHRLSFHRDMEKLAKDPKWAFSQNVLGSWLRVDLPIVMSSVRRSISIIADGVWEDVDTNYILWTDPDVIFQDRIDSCTLPRPQILSVGPEFRMGWPENYGVIYFNVSGYTTIFKGLVDWARKRAFHFDHDQNLFLQYLGSNVTELPNGMNWKPYWGSPSHAIRGPWPHEHVRIVHTHGPKLSTAVCFFNLYAREHKVDSPGVTTSILRRCGLRKSPSGTSVWLQDLADILTNAYKTDRGDYYKKVMLESNNYLEDS